MLTYFSAVLMMNPESGPLAVTWSRPIV